MRVVEKRLQAVAKIAAYWGLSEPKCMLSGCSETEKLEINHVYGNGWKERLTKLKPPRLYWAITQDEYDLSTLNLLCWTHNRPMCWGAYSTLLNVYETKYQYEPSPFPELFLRASSDFEFRSKLQRLSDQEHQEWRTARGYDP